MFLLGNTGPVENVHFRSFSDGINPQLQKVLKRFPIHCLQMLIPGVMKIPDSIEEIMSHDQNNYFLIQDLPATSLVNHTFIEAFLKKGSSCGLSIDSRAGYDNFAAILPTGHLALSLKQEVFENLDLVEDVTNTGGKRKRTKTRASYKSTACVSIHTTAAHFHPDKKNYINVLRELEKINYIRFNFIFNWIPLDTQICPTSVQDYFQKEGFTCHVCKCDYVPELKFSVKIPKITFMEPSDSLYFCSKWDFLEWIGAQTCGIECEEDDSDDFVSSFASPEPFNLMGQMYLGTWRGLIPFETVFSIFKTVSQVFSQNRNIPFIVLIGHGFQDSWMTTETNKQICSCNKMFCIVIFPDLRCWLYTYVGNENIG